MRGKYPAPVCVTHTTQAISTEQGLCVGSYHTQCKLLIEIVAGHDVHAGLKGPEPQRYLGAYLPLKLLGVGHPRTCGELGKRDTWRVLE